MTLVRGDFSISLCPWIRHSSQDLEQDRKIQVTNINNTSQLYLREYCSVGVFLLRKVDLIRRKSRNEATATKTRWKRGRGSVGRSLYCQQLPGRAGWVERKRPPEGLAVSPSSFLIPSAFRERGFLGTNVLSSLFFPHCVCLR